MSPFFILAVGVAIVLVMILVFRTNPFLALILAALAVSLFADGDWGLKAGRVATALGTATGKIGIVIAMAAIIGVCMMASGAAEKIVRSFCHAFGEKHFPTALAGSGFVLSVPVFYDTVFYLLVPLAKSFFQARRRNYMLCLMSICAGAMITHTMVPPTPGPLLIATSLEIPIADMIQIGLLVGVFLFPIGIFAAKLIDWYLPHPHVTFDEENGVARETQDGELPSLLWSLIPVILPVVLIAAASVLKVDPKVDESSTVWVNLIHLLGNKEMAMIIGAGLSILVFYRQKRPTLQKMTEKIDVALRDAGLIILITAAGGAFGEMLQIAGVGDAIRENFTNESGVSGFSLLLVAFSVASMMKLSLGSSTVAMMTTAAIFGALKLTSQDLGFNIAYLGLAISAGSLVTSWMNDSGFWVTSRMAGISEMDTLKSVTVLHIIIGFSGLAFVLLFSQLLPFSS